MPGKSDCNGGEGGIRTLVTFVAIATPPAAYGIVEDLIKLASGRELPNDFFGICYPQRYPKSGIAGNAQRIMFLRY